MKKKKWLVYLIAIAIPLVVGALSALLCNGSMENFYKLNQPALAPPKWLFPVVWNILFVLMGISCAAIYNARAAGTSSALFLYGAQLFVNFWWSIIYFCWELRLFAFVWILLLIALVIGMIVRFRRIQPWTGYLQLPYLAWLFFAAYLNLQYYLLN